MSIRRKINRALYVLAFVAIAVVGIQCNSAQKQKTVKNADHKKFRELYESARKLTPKEAADLDKLVEKEPDNLDAVTKWLIYNCTSWIRDAKIKKKRERIICHLIEKHPEYKIFYYERPCLYQHRKEADASVKAWKEQLKKHPENLEILSNAAYHTSFFNKALCEKCLKKGQQLEPDNPRWSERLGYFYRLNKNYSKSHTELKRAYKQTAVDKQRTLLVLLGQVAYISEKNKEAAQYANEMLKRGEKSSNKWDKAAYLYNASTLLGLLALKDGKVEEACKYLNKSGKVVEKFKKVYVDMSLACMLTFKGKEKCVIEFLNTVEKYSPRNNYKAYIKDLKAGVMPEYNWMSYYNYLPLITNKIYTARRKKFLSIGKTLSPEQVAVLEKELAKLPVKNTTKAYGTITKLVAYYYVNKDKDKSIPEKRRQLIYRLVEYFPRYSLLAYPETWLRFEKSDKKLIALCEANIKKYSAGKARINTRIMNNAACQLATHDRKLAEQALIKRFKVKPSDAKWKKTLDKFYSCINANKPYME